MPAALATLGCRAPPRAGPGACGAPARAPAAVSTACRTPAAGQAQACRRRQRRERSVAARAASGGEEEFFSSRDEEEYYDENDVEYEEEDTSMRLFLDSADVEEWGKWADTGLFFGFTTNPTILKRDDVPCNIASMRNLSREAFQLGVEELQLQAWGTTAAELYSCAMDLMDLDSRIVVKLPITLAGAKAARRLIEAGTPITTTGVYAAHQVVSSLALGATYCAPYLGRMTDAGKDGIAEVSRMQKIVDLSSDGGAMRLLVASIRSADEVAALAAEGCNTMTISPVVAAQLFDEPLTIAAATKFQEHADEMGATRGH